MSTRKQVNKKEPIQTKDQIRLDPKLESKELSIRKLIQPEIKWCSSVNKKAGAMVLE